MKISVITITCRSEPRLHEMAKTLQASLRRALGTVVEWIIVDELWAERRPIIPLLPGDGLFVKHVAPPPTVYRIDNKKRPAHNTFRNAGLACATGDYVILLNDCNLVTASWVSVAAEVAAKGYGWSCRMRYVDDMVVPEDGRIYADVQAPTEFLPTNMMAVAQAAWGAPHEAFVKIRGFDTAYDGERRGNDVDAIIRLTRVGVKFYRTTRAHTIQLGLTKLDAEVYDTSDPTIKAGARNLALLARLKADRDRIWPIGDVDSASRVG